jgi:hypothetical protein
MRKPSYSSPRVPQGVVPSQFVQAVGSDHYGSVMAPELPEADRSDSEPVARRPLRTPSPQRHPGAASSSGYPRGPDPADRAHRRPPSGSARRRRPSQKSWHSSWTHSDSRASGAAWHSSWQGSSFAEPAPSSADLIVKSAPARPATTARTSQSTPPVKAAPPAAATPTASPSQPADIPPKPTRPPPMFAAAPSEAALSIQPCAYKDVRLSVSDLARQRDVAQRTFTGDGREHIAPVPAPKRRPGSAATDTRAPVPSQACPAGPPPPSAQCGSSSKAAGPPPPAEPDPELAALAEQRAAALRRRVEEDWVSSPGLEKHGGP